MIVYTFQRNKTLVRNNIKSYWKKLCLSNSVSIFEQVIDKHPVLIKISPDRNSKYGDFRSYPSERKDCITVNGSLDKNQFTLTLAHELAHKLTWDQYKRKASPHGTEWKFNMKLILQDLKMAKTFPNELQTAIDKYINDWKAVTIRMPELYSILHVNQNHSLLKDLPFGESFKIKDDRVFIKEKQLRTYFLCRCIDTNNHYRIHSLTTIVENK